MSDERDLISPHELAAALGQPRPTDEQAAVIAAPMGPALVVAGAGAGKTETMASRVVWLVANRLVTPDEVLGLTFTRKAAQQLTARIRKRLARLAGSSLLRRVDPGEALRAALMSEEPEVSTYHSYAGRLLQEHGLLLPMEPSARLLGETELWQLAYRVVSGWDGELDTESNPATITQAVLDLSGQLAEHLVDPAALRDAHAELATLIATLPRGPRQRSTPSRKLTGIVEAQERRTELLPLVERLGEELRREGCLDFGSQMSLAARLARDHTAVGESERARFRVVLLDEYQDTGHAQRILLSSLFGRSPRRRRRPAVTAVTAVGDPMQSIYGWRGASAANLPRFCGDFPDASGAPAPRLELLTSWRNPPEALRLANAVADPLRRRGVPVSELRPRPDAGAGAVRAGLFPDVIEERQWVARRIADEYAAARDQGRPVPTAAVLVRRNGDSAPLAEALRAEGLPVEVVGLGGLLDEPEVRDVVSMLRLVADPLAGSAAMRVVTGARWRLGAADLAALWRRARELAVVSARRGDEAVLDGEALAQALDAALPGEHAEDAGLADALADPGRADRYSEDGYRRISALRGEIASLRERIGQPLTELVAEVERTTGVGIEAVARAGAGAPGPGGTASGVAGREHLDAFADVVAGYANSPTATLSGLLAYLGAAESVEKGFTPGEVEVDPERVQVLTVHAAKGLEWEVVAVPHLVARVFPSESAWGTWLGDVTELPPSLRGDRADADVQGEGIPLLDLGEATDRKQLEDAIDRHKSALGRRRGDEERRLLYVALTRTERVLFVSGHHWPESGKAAGPSPFLDELRALIDDGAGRVDAWAQAPDDDASNPLEEQPRSAWWPVDPLGVRREDVEAGAALVFAELGALDDGPAAPDPEGDDAQVGESHENDPEGWAADVDSLLAERAGNHGRVMDVALPHQLSVSQLVELRADPGALAERLRRPLPYPPNPLARRGTAFHAWVERRFGVTRLLDLDELPGAADEGGASDADLHDLQQAFLRSRWAHRNPVEVEVPFETSIAGTNLRGRIDAVFRDEDGGWTVIDWKTGAEPTAKEESSVIMQLAAYRVAWAELAGGAAPLPLERVRAAFHYVRSGRTIAPTDLPDRAGLQKLIESAGATDDAPSPTAAVEGLGTR